MKSLLQCTAIVEALTGVALVSAPHLLVSALIGIPLEGDGALIVARLAGFALFSLAIACWQSRNNADASAILQAMLFYNVTIVALLLYCVVFYKLSAIRLLPVFVLHTGLAVWCVRSLRQ